MHKIWKAAPMQAVACGLVLALLAGKAVAANASISGPPAAFTGQVVTFSIVGLDASGVVNFDDGSSTITISGSATLMHVYKAPGTYHPSVTYKTLSVTTTIIVTNLNTPRVPNGTIYSALPIQGSVLAGNSTSILMTYRVISPPLGIVVTSAPALEAVVALEDERGRLIYRNDPVLLAYISFAGAGIQTVEIPYVVPSDANGRYNIQVFIRVRGLGGTVAVGPRAPFIVTGSPDPQPVVASELHGSGNIEAGPAPSGGANTTPATLNANFKTEYQEPTYVFAAGTTFDSTSLRVDPLFTLDPPAGGSVASPNQTSGSATAVSQPATTETPAPRFHDVVGHVTAQLPSLILVGGEALRGLDATENNSGWSYHAGAGFTQTSTGTSGIQEGDLIDLTRDFNARSDAQVAYINNVDDVNSFVNVGAGGPLSSKTEVAQLDDSLNSKWTLGLAAADSSAASLFKGKGVSIGDKADAAHLNFSNGQTLFDVTYFNTGPEFATSNGLGAHSDDAGGQVSLGAPLSELSKISVQYNRDDMRDALSNTSKTAVAYTVGSLSGATLTLGGTRTQQDSPISATTTRDLNFQFQRPTQSGSSFVINGDVAASGDPRMPSSSGATRNGTAQFSKTLGASNYSFSLTGVDVSGSSKSANVSETFVVSFPLVRRAVTPAYDESHGADLQFSVANTNAKALLASSRLLDSNATLTFHFGPHLTLGAVGDTRHLTNLLTPASDSTRSSLRIDVGMTY